MLPSATSKFPLICLLALTACGGGGSGADGGGSGGVVTPPPLPGTNGLDFGAVGQRISDAAGETVTVRGASFRDDTGAEAQNAQFVFGQDFFDGAQGDLDGSATLFGETVTLTNGEGQLANGQTVRIIFDDNQQATYAAAVQLVAYGSLDTPVPLGALDGEAHHVFGFETNPDTIMARDSGSVTYLGNFVASGVVRNDGGAVVGNVGIEMDGSITVNVNFMNDGVTGSLTGSYETEGQPVDVALTMDPTTISGNGFSTTLSCTGPDCASSSSTDATFFGPLADEVGGTLLLDVTQPVNGNDRQYLGAGTFVIGPSR